MTRQCCELITTISQSKLLETACSIFVMLSKQQYNNRIIYEALDPLAAPKVRLWRTLPTAVDARARDINIMNVTLQHMDAILLEETNVVLNHGNRYGSVGRNGCGKVSCRYYNINCVLRNDMDGGRMEV